MFYIARLNPGIKARRYFFCVGFFLLHWVRKSRDLTLHSLYIQETLQDTPNNRSIFNSILLSRKPIDLSTLLKVFSLFSLLEIILDWIFRFLEFKTWKSPWLFCQYSFSKHFSRLKKTNGSYSPWNRDNFYKSIP